MMELRKYFIGNLNRLCSIAYTTKLPLPARHGASELPGSEIRFHLRAAAFCHFLAVLMSFQGLIILLLFFDIYSVVKAGIELVKLGRASVVVEVKAKANGSKGLLA